MPYLPDLSPCTEVHVAGWRLLSVGWLDATAPFATAPADPQLVERLRVLGAREQPLLPVAPGWHECNLGDCARRPGFDPRRCASGVIFIPHASPRSLYCAPRLITHYVADHAYALPEEVRQALAVSQTADVPVLEPDMGYYEGRSRRRGTGGASEASE
ncbi:MAG: hypothetical protein M9894_07780 [Planctomycetes bacterium]|nr:hypothetical protein [Planctomycetota bacterium]